jgi:F0F1-type ATP synthase assembly protein I
MTDESEKGKNYRRLAIYSSVIFLLPSTLLGGYFLGHFLDGYLDTGRWFSIAGLFLGAIGGFIHLFRLLNRS